MLGKEQPDFVVYNAGTDIYLADPLGRLSITEEGIIERDNDVLETALKEGIPILMVLSGGYHRRSGEIIARSIQRFLKTRLAR